MLTNLHVKNLALIDEVEVEFGEGLNILSGETGAGKSIIIGSINLALGEKASKELVRDNSQSAFVELLFYVDHPQVEEQLKALDIELEDGMLILNRKITSGRSIARINGEAVSASKLKEVASLLIDIHGQHEHQSLLHKKKHLEILDAYAKEELGDKLIKLNEAYKKYKELLNEWEHSNVDAEERSRELAFLSYEVKEIEDANLQPNEDEELEQLYRRFSNGKKIMDALSAASSATAGDGENASELISRALRELSSVSTYDTQIEGLESQLTEIDNLLSDFNHELTSYLSGDEFDDETYYETEKRLDFINHLKSKYGNSIAEILDACAKKQERIDVLSDYDNYLSGLQQSVEKQKEQLQKLCDSVSKIRKKAAKTLCASITTALQELNFLDVRFEMEFRTVDYTAKGTDDVEFVISTNPGEPLRPLGKVASGGELSRIMLAIKTVMAEMDDIGTLIFDEIDTGISGRTAQMVSEKMNVIGRNHQVICITHLPQIAAMADSHFLIEKSVENKNTHSRIHRLSEEDSVLELARMLGGVEITDTVRSSAQEMKELARSRK